MSKKSSSSSETEETTTAETVQEAAETTEAAATVETSENTESVESVNSENTESASEETKKSTTEKAVESEPKYGLVRFLQINPLSSYEESLLKAMYKSDVMTKSEWLEKLNAILNKKVR